MDDVKRQRFNAVHLQMLHGRVNNLKVRIEEMAEELAEMVNDLDALYVEPQGSVGLTKVNEVPQVTTCHPGTTQDLRNVPMRLLRPFVDANEFCKGLYRHGNSIYRRYTTIACRNERAVRHDEFAIGSAGVFVDGEHRSWDELFAEWRFDDGCPLGLPK